MKRWVNCVPELAGTHGQQKVSWLLPYGSLVRLDNQPHAAAGFAQVHDAQNEKLKAQVVDLVKRGAAVNLYWNFSPGTAISLWLMPKR